MKKQRTNSALAAAISAILAPTTLTVTSVHAQEGATLEEVVVTARRRDESLQTIPIAVTAFTGDELEMRGVETVGSMNAMAPNLSVQGGAGRGIESQANFRIRGMPGVAVYVDGIDQSNNTGLFTMGVLEVERIEILRGPQGTLFGNSSLGGAIQYVTRRPGNEFGGRVQARTGSFNRRDIQATLDLPLSPNFLTKFTFANLERDGYVTSYDAGVKYGDMNDQFARADFLWTPTDSLSVRYSFDTSEQDRQGGARATFEIGPSTVFDVGGVQVNSNAAAQAYQNAYGITYQDAEAATNVPGGVLGPFGTRISHENNGFYLNLQRHNLDISWDINDNLTFRSLLGQRDTERRVMVDFDSDSRVAFADRQDNDEIDDQSMEFQLLGTHGDNEQFSWIVGAFNFESSSASRFPTFASHTLNCDLWPGSRNASGRGMTDADRAGCYHDRLRALNVTDPALIAPAGATATEIRDLWNQVVALNPNYLGVTPATLAGTVGPNNDVLQFTDTETQAFYADLSWNVTDAFTLSVGVRRQEDENLGTQRALGANIAEPFPWNNVNYTLRDPFGFNGISQNIPGTEFEATTSRVSLQYQVNDTLMTYLTVADGYAPGGRSTAPAGILQVDSSTGIATGGFLRDVHNAGLSDLPFEIVRDEQTVDSYEIGMKADWADGRLRTNMSYFYTDWRNMTGSTYVATIYWDQDGDGFADIDGLVPCAARCTQDGQNEILWFPNLLTSAVSKAEASGFELEVTWLGGENFALGGNLGLLDTEFVELGQAGLGTVPAYAEGDKFAGAPDMTYNIWGQYDWMLGAGGSLSARMDYTWTDDYTTFAGGPLQRTQDSFGLLNARLTYDSGNDWILTVAGTNLTDEYYSPSFFYTVSQQLWSGSIGRPREVMLGLTFQF
jgi:outer membrane receptor protein involved in Fe transport